MLESMLESCVAITTHVNALLVVVLIVIVVVPIIAAIRIWCCSNHCHALFLNPAASTSIMSLTVGALYEVKLVAQLTQQRNSSLKIFSTSLLKSRRRGFCQPSRSGLGIVDDELPFEEQKVSDGSQFDLGPGTSSREKFRELRGFGGELGIVSFDVERGLLELGDGVFILLKEDHVPLVVECSSEKGLMGETEDFESWGTV
ncbi:uncharacterized protein HKW66_Vig0150310 [Vigna angularis]|uniref:Uncharacterized protein n=1 Tax=Phaseolus angularis TaxID=3914 RepID=A0A8T0JUC2_PHAAN|nr:uncharacterized protein HKW66_Vig0150310 [Vigna angularis]